MATEQRSEPSFFIGLRWCNIRTGLQQYRRAYDSEDGIDPLSGHERVWLQKWLCKAAAYNPGYSDQIVRVINEETLKHQ